MQPFAQILLVDPHPRRLSGLTADMPNCLRVMTCVSSDELEDWDEQDSPPDLIAVSVDAAREGGDWLSHKPSPRMPRWPIGPNTLVLYPTSEETPTPPLPSRHVVAYDGRLTTRSLIGALTMSITRRRLRMGDPAFMPTPRSPELRLPVALTNHWLRQSYGQLQIEFEEGRVDIGLYGGVPIGVWPSGPVLTDFIAFLRDQGVATETQGMRRHAETIGGNPLERLRKAGVLDSFLIDHFWLRYQRLLFEEILVKSVHAKSMKFSDGDPGVHQGLLWVPHVAETLWHFTAMLSRERIVHILEREGALENVGLHHNPPAIREALPASCRFLERYEEHLAANFCMSSMFEDEELPEADKLRMTLVLYIQGLLHPVAANLNIPERSGAAYALVEQPEDLRPYARVV
ncbi:MAG: hypothetical protein H6684_03810 [Deltaproteobacteria bacterium]|nr:hypothetical protein [bacterium]MCB9477797.1 hypothetical protein [Deltaproteobacteria bacterium]MCB9478956.1 hypothetical protein [Deltaproteobacteria bacterium]MCB9487839.1 hypothetical protein [Deltaproteobacteria bacterium]